MFAALQYLDDNTYIRRAWEIIGENITIPIKDVLGNEDQIKFG
jgi:hypothetical protein